MLARSLDCGIRAIEVGKAVWEPLLNLGQEIKPKRYCILVRMTAVIRMGSAPLLRWIVFPIIQPFHSSV